MPDPENHSHQNGDQDSDGDRFTFGPVNLTNVNAFYERRAHVFDAYLADPNTFVVLPD